MTTSKRKAPRLVALAAVLSTFLAPPTSKAQDPVHCSNTTMHGTYALSESGFAGSAPLGGVGEVIYDGHGNGTLVSETLSLNGTISKGITGTGVFTVNSNCTGSKTFTTSAGEAHFDFVITADGSTITFIQTDSGVVGTGTAIRISRREDED